MRFHRFHLFPHTFLLIFLVVVVSSSLTAQDATGRIVGTVTDRSGAVIPGADFDPGEV